jgi:SpoVK/Ycf46/Vps4 family AAA+-type ATPase
MIATFAPFFSFFQRYSGADLRLLCKEAAMRPMRALLAELEAGKRVRAPRHYHYRYHHHRRRHHRHRRHNPAANLLLCLRRCTTPPRRRRGQAPLRLPILRCARVCVRACRLKCACCGVRVVCVCCVPWVRQERGRKQETDAPTRVHADTRVIHTLRERIMMFACAVHVDDVHACVRALQAARATVHASGNALVNKYLEWQSEFKSS